MEAHVSLQNMRVKLLRGILIQIEGDLVSNQITVLQQCYRAAITTMWYIL